MKLRGGENDMFSAAAAAPSTIIWMIPGQKIVGYLPHPAPSHLKMFFFCSPTFPVGICKSGVNFPGYPKIYVSGPFAPSWP